MITFLLFDPIHLNSPVDNVEAAGCQAEKDHSDEASTVEYDWSIILIEVFNMVFKITFTTRRLHLNNLTTVDSDDAKLSDCRFSSLRLMAFEANESFLLWESEQTFINKGLFFTDDNCNIWLTGKLFS